MTTRPRQIRRVDLTVNRKSISIGLGIKTNVFLEIHEFLYDRRTDIKERLNFLLRNSYKKTKFTSHSASPVGGGVPFALQNRPSSNMYVLGNTILFPCIQLFKLKKYCVYFP